MHIDFLGLQAFLAIVEYGSFQQAAAELNLSQTAISHRLRKLEQLVGMRLLVRARRQITLTDGGRELLPRARAAVRELSLSLDALRAGGDASHAWLAIACLPTIAAEQLAPVLSDFSNHHPALHVRVFDTSPMEIADLVESDAVAFGVTIDTPRIRKLTRSQIVDEAFVLACPRDSRFSGMRSVSWADLDGEPLIRISLPAGNGATIEDAIVANRHTLHWRFEVQHTAAALSLVRAGLGLTVVPRCAVVADDRLALRPLVSPVVSRRLLFVTRPDTALEGAAALLRDMISRRLLAATDCPI